MKKFIGLLLSFVIFLSGCADGVGNVNNEVNYRDDAYQDQQKEVVSVKKEVSKVAEFEAPITIKREVVEDKNEPSNDDAVNMVSQVKVPVPQVKVPESQQKEAPKVYSSPLTTSGDYNDNLDGVKEPASVSASTVPAGEPAKCH